MSEIILPGEDQAEPPRKFVVGRNVLPTVEMIGLQGQIVVLRKFQDVQGIVFRARDGWVGILQCVAPLPHFPKRVHSIGVLSFTGPGNYMTIPAEVLMVTDPWCHPPGFPERAVSLLDVEG